MLFYKNYIVYYSVYPDYCGVFNETYVYSSMYKPSFVMIGCCVSELCSHLCPHHNVFSEVVILFTTMFTVIIVVC